MSTVQYQVSGLTCQGCVKRVGQVLDQYAEKASVTLEPPQASLTNPSADLSTLNSALSEIGQYQLSVDQTISDATEPHEQSWFATYRPLLLVIGYILLTSLVVEVVNGNFVLARWMQHFMAGFFLVFSFFKMLDIRGFADSYAMYDLLAKRIYGYGLLYPFIELALGIGYLSGWQPYFVNWLTVIVMGFSTIGVLLAVMDKKKIRCACLGTGFNLPMSTVTIIEDITMVLMAAWMIIR